MPFALIIIGVVLVVASVRGTVTDSGTTPGLVTLVRGDFTGANNFSYWLVAILAIGALGYVEAIKPLSRIFLVLVVIGLFLSNGGFFQKFNAQVYGANSSTPSTPTVSNVPVNFGGIMGSFTGDPSYLPSLGIENPIKSARNN